MQELKADTSVKVKIMGAVAVGDGFTPVTNLTLSGADEAELFKHDAAAVTDISGRTFAAISAADGSYNLTLTAGDLDTEGMLDITINDDSLILPIFVRLKVVSAQFWDSKYGTDKLQVDMVEINSVAASAVQLAKSAGLIISGTVDNTGHTPTTTEFEADDVTEATADHYNGRIILFDAGALLGQATTIEDYAIAAGRGHFTVTAMTEAPGNNDTFVIV